MNTQSDKVAAPREVTDCLVRIQQMLLAAKYSYVAGDEDAWPATAVQMNKEGATLLIMPFIPNAADDIAELWNTRRKQVGEPAALIVAGTLDTHDPQVRTLFDYTKGTVAYLDVERGEFHRARRRIALTSSPPGAVHKTNLKKFLSPEPDPKSVHISCRNRLAADLAEIRQTQQFLTRAEQVAGSGGLPATYLLLGACVVLFIAMVIQSGELAIPSGKTLITWGALYGPLVRHGQLWRIVSCAFVHIGIMHILFNAWAMFIFGAWVEKLQGRWLFGAFYLFSVVTASLASLWWHPMVVSAGASGGIFGMIGVMGAIILRHRREFPAGLRRTLCKWLLTILVYSAILLANPIIDHAAHAGGLLGGFAIAMLLSRSPVKHSRPGLLAWVGAAVLFFAIAVFGIHTIRAIPADAPLEPPGTEWTEEIEEIRKTMNTLSRRWELLDNLKEETKSWEKLAKRAEKLYDSAENAAAQQQAADEIEKEILPYLGEQAEAKINEVETELGKEGEICEKTQLALTAARDLLKAQNDYCKATMDVLQGQGLRGQVIDKMDEVLMASYRFTMAFSDAYIAPLQDVQ